KAVGPAVQVLADFIAAHVEGKTQVQLARYVKHFQISQPKGQKSKRMEGKAKFVMRFEEHLEAGKAAVEILEQILVESKAEEVIGSAPRVREEREISAILNKR
ncbi:unnamed protein product, partial [Prorocentrum cordatum]